MIYPFPLYRDWKCSTWRMAYWIMWKVNHIKSTVPGFYSPPQDEYEDYIDPQDELPPGDPFGDIYVPVGDDEWGIDPVFLDFILGD